MGGQYVPAAMCVFSAKVSGHLLYVAGVWTNAITKNIDCPLISFLLCILGFPKCIAWIILHAELGGMSLEAKT